MQFLPNTKNDFPDNATLTYSFFPNETIIFCENYDNMYFLLNEKTLFIENATLTQFLWNEIISHENATLTWL